MTDDLSEAVESSLADFPSKERTRQDGHAKALVEAIVTWNIFAHKHGSFADEHSTL